MYLKLDWTKKLNWLNHQPANTPVWFNLKPIQKEKLFYFVRIS